MSTIVYQLGQEFGSAASQLYLGIFRGSIFTRSGGRWRLAVVVSRRGEGRPRA